MPADTDALVRAIYTEAHRSMEPFEASRNHDDDFSFAIAGIGRFRVNVFRQRGSLGAVIRVIPFTLPNPCLLYTSNTNLSNYDISVTVGQLRIINPAAPYTLTLQANSLETLYDGQEHSVSGFEGQDENGTIFVKLAEDGATFRVTGLTSHASATHATVNKEQGGLSTTIETDPAGVFVFDEDGNNVSNLFNVVPVAGKLLINPRQVTLTSADLEKPYDGTPLVLSLIHIWPASRSRDRCLSEDSFNY